MPICFPSSSGNEADEAIACVPNLRDQFDRREDPALPLARLGKSNLEGSRRGLPGIESDQVGSNFTTTLLVRARLTESSFI
jgi:hypothetical protein